MQIRFADFELDTQRYSLRRRGRKLPIRPKVFDLLIHLVCHRERVVPHTELVELLWGQTIVGGGSLSGLVNELRKGMGERGDSTSSIRTVHARGYQFVADVLEELDAFDADMFDESTCEPTPVRRTQSDRSDSVRAPISQEAISQEPILLAIADLARVDPGASRLFAELSERLGDPRMLILATLGPNQKGVSRADRVVDGTAGFVADARVEGLHSTGRGHHVVRALCESIGIDDPPEGLIDELCRLVAESEQSAHPVIQERAAATRPTRLDPVERQMRFVRSDSTSPKHGRGRE